MIFGCLDGGIDIITLHMINLLHGTLWYFMVLYDTGTA